METLKYLPGSSHMFIFTVNYSTFLAVYNEVYDENSGL
jgi:hypothetical protein